MSGSFKKWYLKIVGFLAELTQGTPNYSHTASGGTANTITVAAATGASLYDSNGTEIFARCQVYFKSNTTTAALQGKIYTVLSYAWVGDVATFTTTANMDASPQATDTFMVYGLLKTSDSTFEPKTENLERDDIERMTMDPFPSCKGLTMGSGSFNFEIAGLAQENGNGDTPTIDMLGQFLKCYGTRRSVTGTLCDAGWTTVGGDVDDASDFNRWDWIKINGEVTRISSKSGDTLVVSPPLSEAPDNLDEVFSNERFTPVEEDHQAYTLLGLMDDQFVEMQGCVLSLSASASYGEKVMGQAEYDAEGWDLTDSFTWQVNHTDQCPVKATTGRSYFGTTQISVNSFDWNSNYERSELRDDEINNRFFLTARKAACSVVFRNKNVTPKETWEAAGTQDLFLLQRGNTAGACVAFVGNAQIQDPLTYTENEGHNYYDAAFGFVDAHTYSAVPSKPEIVRF